MLKKAEVLLQLERTRRFPGGSLSLGEMGVGEGVGGQSWDPQQDTRGTATADSTCSHTPVVRERTRGTEDAHGGSSGPVERVPIFTMSVKFHLHFK